MPRTVDIAVRLTDDEIKKLHAPIPHWPKSSLNAPCLCPVCRPKREPVT